MALTQQQIDRFHHDGYLKFGKILEDSEIELLQEQYDLEFEKAQQNGRFRNLATEDGSATVATERQMLQIMQMCERNIHFRKLLFDARILDVIEDLIGPNIQLFHDQALYKPAFNGGPVFWHQDNAYWKCRPALLVSCWLTLDDVDDTNGAMNVLPGSHLNPVWHAPKDGDALLETNTDIDESRVEIIDLPAGGCMFHHCQTLHTTKPNQTDRQRRAFAMHFMIPGTRYVRNDESSDMPVTWSRPLLRARI